MSDELWHNDRNLFITAKKEVDAVQFFQYLRNNLRSFPQFSVFLFITGHHIKGLNKSNEAILGETDAGLHASIGAEWECFDKKLGKKCKEKKNCSPRCDYCVWQEKQFSIDRLFVETNDVDIEGIYEPSKASLVELNVKSQSLRESEFPYVVVFATDWSHYSPITTLFLAKLKK